LGNALQEVYDIICRIKNRGNVYKQVEILVAQLDLEAKLDTVGSLMVEIHTTSTSIQTAIRHLQEVVEKIKHILEQLTEEADNHSKKWLAGWRGVPAKMTHDMKKLEENAQVFDTRLDLLLRLLAAQPSALIKSGDAIPQSQDHPEISTNDIYKTFSIPSDPSGPPPLPGLEQSWLIVDRISIHDREQSPQDHKRSFEEFVEKQDHPHRQDVIEINEIPVPSQRQDLSEIDEVRVSCQRQDVSDIDESRGQMGRQDVIEVSIIPSQHVMPLDIPRADVIPLGQVHDLDQSESGPNEKLLEEMAKMGFVDMEVNRRVLEQTGNNIQLAISMILRDE